MAAIAELQSRTRDPAEDRFNVRKIASLVDEPRISNDIGLGVRATACRDVEAHHAEHHVQSQPCGQQDNDRRRHAPLPKNQQG